MLYANLEKNMGSNSIRARFTTGKDGIIALFGASGSGKTTLVNMLAGIVTPTSGKIRLHGQWVFHSQLNIDCPPEKRRFGYVFQEGRLFPHLTVRGNLNYGRKLLPVSQRLIDFDHAVNLLEIESLLHRRPKYLSGGEKQRVAIGRALLMSPLLLLMDEPLAALDNQCKSEILPFVSLISKTLSIPVIYVSHSLEEIRKLTSDILYLEKQPGEKAAPARKPVARPPVLQWNVANKTCCSKTYKQPNSFGNHVV